MLPKSILVPTDLSEHADAALAYACELAGKLGAQLHLVNVIGVPALGVPELGVALTGTMIDGLVADNKTAIDRVADSVRARGVSVGQVLLKTGDAKDMINEAAVEVGADLIVMSTHGRTGVKRALLGSIAETVVRSAPCAVLTIKEDEARKAA